MIENEEEIVSADLTGSQVLMPPPPTPCKTIKTVRWVQRAPVDMQELLTEYNKVREDIITAAREKLEKNAATAAAAAQAAAPKQKRQVVPESENRPQVKTEDSSWDDDFDDVFLSLENYFGD